MPYGLLNYKNNKIIDILLCAKEQNHGSFYGIVLYDQGLRVGYRRMVFGMHLCLNLTTAGIMSIYNGEMAQFLFS